MSQAPFAPFIARLGGLEVERFAGFENSLVLNFEHIQTLESDLQLKRQEMVDLCHRAIGGETRRDRRRALLAIKRCCFNGRPLASQWITHGDLAPATVQEAAQSVRRLETELNGARQAWFAAIDHQLVREQSDLLALLDDSAFRCGLAIANADVAARLDELAKGHALSPRRRRRLLETLTRYAGRAAFKTSPFSTFTWLGLGELTEEDAGPLQRVDAPEAPANAPETQLRSLVRLRRHWLDRLQALLLRYEPFRNSLRLELNSSLQQLDDGRHRWMRTSYWRVDTEEKRLSFEEEAVIRSRLNPKLIQPFFELLGSGPMTFEALSSALADPLGALAPKAVAQLLEAGFITPIWPWTIHEGYLEKEMLRRLRDLPRSNAFESFYNQLEHLVELQEGLLVGPRPDRDRRQIETTMESLLQRAAEAVDLGEYAATKRWARNDVYQDVWVGGDRPVLELSAASARRAVESVRPLLRFSRLFDVRVDFLYTLCSLLQELRPGAERLPFMEVFDLALPLWRDYVAFRKSAIESNAFVFNPRGLEVLDRLLEIRATANDQLQSFCRETDQGQRIDHRALLEWLEGLPPRFTDPLAGPGLFLQPADDQGELWMLNRIKEGTGRFTSRFAAVMPEETRRRHVNAWRDRSWWRVDDETAQYLDVQSICGDTLNVHEPQTALTFLLPGQDAETAEGGARGLTDLFVHLGADGWPELRDGQGRRCIPVHLGGGYDDYMPLLLRLLCAFGPSEAKGRFPKYSKRAEGDVTTTERTLLGSVVLHRRSWTFDTAGLAGSTKSRPLSERYEQVQRWRRELGLPRRVFASEAVVHPVSGTKYQPQYLDLESPTFVDLFCDMLSSKQAPERLCLWEMLPDPSHYPKDSRGHRRAVEIVLDDAMLNAPESPSSAQPSKPFLAFAS